MAPLVKSLEGLAKQPLLVRHQLRGALFPGPPGQKVCLIPTM